MTIYLDYYKANKVDLKEYYRKYDDPKSSYKLLNGAPLLVNVEGHYVKANDLPDLVCNRRFIPLVNKWIMELKNPSNVSSRGTLDFKWKR